MAGEAAGVTVPSGGAEEGSLISDTTGTRIRVLVVDDDRQLGPMLADSLESEPDLDVVGVCTDGEEAVAFVLASPPDVVMMDLQMPGMDGYTATRKIREAGVSTRVIALTNLDTEASITRVIAAGSHGCLAKGSRTSLIINTIRLVVLHGVTVLPEHASGWLGVRMSAAARYGLSERQVRILKHIAAGESRAAITAAEHISRSTLKTDVQNLEHQLGVRGWEQLATQADQLGLE